MKLIKHTNGIRIALFATFLLLSGLNLTAQYKLELEWQKETEWITSITKSDNDSLLYVAFENVISTIRTSDGSIVKSDSVDGTYNLIMSKDGKTLVASSGTGVGLLDPLTFEHIFFEFTPKSDFRTLSFNETQSKYVICGPSGFIKVYDVNTKSLFKEFKPKYSVSGDILLKNSRLSGDGKYIIYSYVTNVQKFKNYLTIMDLEGNIVKEILETSSINFTITNDGKTLIYFMSDAIHFLDLETMKEIEGIQLGGLNPENIELSNDGRSIWLGFNDYSKITNSLVYCELETKKYYVLNDNTSWRNFKLSNNISSLFLGIGDLLAKFNLTPNTSISNDKSKIELKIILLNDKLILSNPQNYQINTLTAYDILGRTYSLSANGNEVDVSSFSAGRYFLKVGLANGSFLDFGFVVE